MWPREVDWQALRFGVEIEFVGVEPKLVELLEGWAVDPRESMRELSGDYGGGEIKSPPIDWSQRTQIHTMMARIQAAGGMVNWSCGFHVHISLGPWGLEAMPALMDATLATQDALRELFMTPAHRMIFCPSLTPTMRDAWLAEPEEDALCHEGRPQGARCGLNLAAWYEFETLELRFPNGTLDAEQALRCVEVALRWVVAVGRGVELPSELEQLIAVLELPPEGYPPALAEPTWHRREEQLSKLLIPVLRPLIAAKLPGAEPLWVRPTPEGLYVKTDSGNERNHRFWFEPHAGGFRLVRFEDAG